MNPEVLICSSIYDFSTDLVCLELGKVGVDYLRLNRERLQDCRISLDPQTPIMAVRMNGTDYQVGPKLKSVWFRQPVFLRNTPPEPLSVSQQLERSQWTAFLRGLSVFDQVAWVNFPASTYLAESKPYQLHVASRLGFAVPKSCISNDAPEIKRRFPDSAAIKSLDTVLVHEGDDYLFTYTTEQNTSDISAETVRSAPLLAQEFLRNKKDLRITIVGDIIFAVRILADGRGIEADWRTVLHDKVQYEDVELSAELSRMCQALMKELNLSYGAIDLVETPEETYFIEINPTGEWGWLNGVSRPISSTIASWLDNPK